MQKRKTQFTLPLAHQDDGSVPPRHPGRARRTKAGSSNRWRPGFNKSTLIICVNALLAISLLLFGLNRYSLVPNRVKSSLLKLKGFRIRMRHNQVDDVPHQQRVLAQFGTLQYALDNSQLVALYFAASWCPQSTPVSERIDQVLNDLLLPPPAPGAEVPLPQRHGLSLVYVSSDESVAEFDATLRSRPHWMAVPFDSPERTGLKRHFHVCAQRELEGLHWEERDRQHEIPTLVIVDGASHQVLTFGGAQDIMELGPGAVDEWFALAKISQALEQKFEAHANGEDDDSGGSESNSGDEGV